MLTATATQRTARETLDAALAPALAAYGEALEAHNHTYGTPTPACSCGYEGRSRRGVGMHIAAAHKAASKAFDAASAAVIAAR